MSPEVITAIIAAVVSLITLIGAAMARIPADSGPGDDAPAFTREALAEAWGIRE